MGSYINFKHKWGFMHIPKTGGTTVGTLLKDIKNTVEIPHKFHSQTKDFPKNYFLFTFVRNPYTRYLSLYLDESKDKRFNGSLRNFTKFTDENYKINIPSNSDNIFIDTYFFNLKISPQYDIIKNGEEEFRKINYIAKYENFQNEINFIFNQLNLLVPNNIPQQNPSTEFVDISLKEEFHNNLLKDSYVKDYIKERYKDDFYYLNYEF
jgi:hypothetical protein